MHLLKYILFFKCICFLSVSSFASPSPPSFRSTAVAVSGSVTLYWVPPSDTGINFHSYAVYRSINAAGPFTFIDSIFNYSQNSYLDNAVNANTAKYFYYVITRSDCCTMLSPPSDTLSTLKLKVTNSGNGIAYLSWNALHTPKLATSSSWYLIYAQYTPSPFALIDSTQQLNFFDTITVCDSQVNYRVELKDAANFISVSSVDGDIFRDLIPPSLTATDTVSVNPFTGETTISWNINYSKDTKGYIIYKFNGVSWDSIGTVYGYNNTSFLNTASNANNVSEKYTIATIDSCNNSTGFSTDHSTIFLKTSLNKCERTIDLTWNPYVNMSGGLSSYKIFVSENAGTFQPAGTVDGGTNSYSYSNLNVNSNYCFFVQAIGNNSSKTSSSNMSCMNADIFNEPLFTYIRAATIAGSNEADIKCYVDTAAEVVSYKLLRSENPSGPFDSIASIDFDGTPGFTIIDNSISASDRPYYYQLVPLDSCGNSLAESNIAKTIFVKSIAENNFINLVTWDDYQGWDNGTGYFNIYRKVSPSSPSLYIASVASDKHEYRDDVTEFYKLEGQFCYRVEAVERAGNPFGFRDSALSNETCNWQIPITFVPNAFSPNGKNPVFLPSNVFVNTSDYSFKVFDRWGQNVFETHDVKTGWTGAFKNREAPMGVYVYFIRYLDNNGNEVKSRGTVTLIR